MPPHGGSTACRGSPQSAAFALGRPVNHERVARQVAAAGLQGLTRREGWRRAKPDTFAFAEDPVARAFRPAGPDELWVADITQHPTREGWVDCAVVIDAYSRLGVGHATGDHLRTELVNTMFEWIEVF